MLTHPINLSNQQKEAISGVIGETECVKSTAVWISLDKTVADCLVILLLSSDYIHRYSKMRSTYMVIH